VPKQPNEISKWQIIAAIISVLIAVAVMAVQWQTTVDEMSTLRKAVAGLEQEVDLNKDEQTAQNRERRDAVARVESRVAVLESQVKELQK